MIGWVGITELALQIYVRRFLPFGCNPAAGFFV
jgi:hypothetical protein